MSGMFAPPHLQSLDHATAWIGTRPPGEWELPGRVVLVNFFTSTCINWLRQLPHLRAWSSAYRDEGLVVVHVHTPEFSFERDVARVGRAVRSFGIDDPVAVDDDYAVWHAFANRYWPALYLFDPALRDFHYGEGRYAPSERVIQKLLRVDRRPAPVDAPGIHAPASWHTLRATETYLGSDRGERFASPGGAVPARRHTYRFPDGMRGDRWALHGDWTIEPECVVLDDDSGAIAGRFHARDVHLVLSRRATAPIEFRVRLDGGPPGPSHGGDVDADGNGLLDDGRLYHLVRQDGGVQTRSVEITLSAPGAEAFAFSFG